MPGSTGWCARNYPPSAASSLAYALNGSGGIVSEFTITRTATDEFQLLSAAAAEWHDEDLLHRALPSDGSVRIEPHTEAFGTLVLCGAACTRGAADDHRRGSVQ